ncbi:MAG TPA: membrane protein insertion efficiency factor YidD, partial [Deinococcales bacterium]|nr:membrane protein insertion efficiency factor YidD [Deinococcales bacterium]
MTRDDTSRTEAGQPWWRRQSPLALVLTAAIAFYRRYLSPLKGAASCRYHPTCSQYALDAIRLHGAIKGTALAVWRVLRCNPLSMGG